MIISFILSDNYSEQAVKKFSKEFQQHKRKIKLSSKIKVIITSLFEGDLSNDIVEKFKYSEEYIDNLNDFKNLSLYTFIDSTSAFKPSDIIDSEEVIELIKKDAQVKLLGTEQFCSVALNDLDKMITLLKNHK